MIQQGLFDIAELLGPFPALVVCETGDCGGWRKVVSRAEADHFAVDHAARHEGGASIGCWPQQPTSLAAVLGDGPDFPLVEGATAPAVPDAAGEDHAVRAAAAVVDLAAWRGGRHHPEATTGTT